MKGFAFALFVVGACRIAVAQSAGDTIISVGGTWLNFTNSSAANVQSTSSAGGFTSTGTNAEIHNAATGEVLVTHFFSDHLAAELAMGWPPRLNLFGQGNFAPLGSAGPQLSLGGLRPLASTNAWAPIFLLKYYFGSRDGQLRPFIGLGANYTWYSHITLNSTLSQAAQQFAGPGGSVQSSLSPSRNPVVQAGMSCRLAEHWFATATLLYVPLRTTVTIGSTAANGMAKLTNKSRITANPIVGFLGVGYRF